MKNCCDQAIKGSQDWDFGVWMQEHYPEIVEEYQNTFKECGQHKTDKNAN